MSKEATSERSAKVAKVKVKEEVIEEKTPKEKANREHYEGKVGILSFSTFS